jgi:hypothetical protein
VEGCRRSKHVEVHGTDGEMCADRRTEDGQSAWPGDLVDDVHACRGIGERADQDARDGAAAHHAEQPGHVVQVEVRDHEQRNLTDAEIAQAAVDGHRVRAGVDLHCRARCGGQQQRVTLPDVTGRKQPPGRRPCRGHRPDRDEDDDRGGGRRAEHQARPATQRCGGHH